MSLFILSLALPLFRWYFFQCLLQQCPERSGGGYESTLCCGVWTAKGRTETDHIEVWILAQNNRALQSGMVHLNDAILSFECFIHLQEQVQDF